MAYCGAGSSSGSYVGEIGEYQYDLLPYQASLPFPDSYSYDEPKYLEYYPTNHSVYAYSDFDDPAFLHPYPRSSYDSYSNYPEMNYSVYTLSEPKLITYEPVPCHNGYALSQTQFLISYSTKNSEFDDLDFEEYDPTPYDGGFDITLTYGKPLPPSDKICYPRSTPEPNGLPPSENIPIETIPSATPKNGEVGNSEALVNENEKVSVLDSETPHNAIVKIDDTEIGSNNGESEDMLSIENVSEVGELDEDENRQVEYSYSDYGYDYPWSGYDYYGNGKQVREGPPCEYNPYTVDLCESIFGHWPCLARMQQKGNGIKEDVGNGGGINKNPWERTAEYIFGDPWGKDEGRYINGGSSYGCENYYQKQPSRVKEVYCDDNSWNHQLNIL